MFAVTQEHTGPIDAVFDRAALVALDATSRARYAKHITSLLYAGAAMLLVTFDYDQSEMDGPPFAVSNDEVVSLYGDGFDIEFLDSRNALNDVMRERGLTRFETSAYALVRKG